jgi:hypothetical protein
MPLNKTIEINNTGLNVTYWRETEVKIDGKNNLLWCKLEGYTDKTAYLAGKNFAMDRGFSKTLPGAYLAMTVTDLVLDMRDFIKTAVNSNGVVEFSGATNAT